MLVLIHKNGSTLDCKNYRTIALISQVGKVLMMILNRRLQTKVELDLADEQAGFGKTEARLSRYLYYGVWVCVRVIILIRFFTH